MLVRMLGPGDAAWFDHIADDVFDHAVDAALAREFLGDPRHHMAAALLDGQLVGMASAVHYVHPDKPAELWINEVGVGTQYRQRGIAAALLAALKARGRELGCREAWVLTEPENLAARRLYSSAGGTETTAVYVTIPLA